MATSLTDPLLFNGGSTTGSINDSEGSMAAVVSSMEAGNYSYGAVADIAAAAPHSPPARPPSKKKKARADTSHLASARIDPAALSPFLDDTDEPILLGRGGFGAVFLANLRGHHDVVAVKMMRDLANPRAVAMFRKEYRLHLRLSMRCEGVCRMFGICENHGLFKTCFVMKRYKCSLLDEIRAVPGGGGITMARLLELGATVARTMATLHFAHNLIVADLKVRKGVHFISQSLPSTSLTHISPLPLSSALEHPHRRRRNAGHLRLWRLKRRRDDDGCVRCHREQSGRDVQPRVP